VRKRERELAENVDRERNTHAKHAKIHRTSRKQTQIQVPSMLA